MSRKGHTAVRTQWLSALAFIPMLAASALAQHTKADRRAPISDNSNQSVDGAILEIQRTSDAEPTLPTIYAETPSDSPLAALPHTATTDWSRRSNLPPYRHSEASVCGNSELNMQVRQALRLACDRPIEVQAAASAGGLIVIGFLGGFVQARESKHPEVWFGYYLRERYPSALAVAAFSNHDGRDAMTAVLRTLDADHDGLLTADERSRARIVIYGHSWGASEAVAFAQDLDQVGIPVLLTVQIDIVRKPGQHPTVVPSNVHAAINLFQSEGLLHGRSEITAEDPHHTRIIGNFHMTYDDHHVDCRNYPFLPRTFNKPHHEIENDARVWNQVAAVIEGQLSSPGTPGAQASAR